MSTQNDVEPPGGEPQHDDSAPSTRRDLLRVAGVGVVGAVAGGLVIGTDAQAANGDPLAVGNTANAASAATKLTSSGTVAAPALQVEALNYDTGIEGDGIYGVTGIGASGGFFSGTDVAVSLDPSAAPGPPTPTVAFKGDLSVDSNGILWICIANGSPGTWIRLSSVNLLSTPQRLYDSRLTVGLFSNGEIRNLDVAGVLTGIPSNATGIIGNLTVNGTIGEGFVVAFPKGTSAPSTATNNWYGANQTLGNAFTVGLGGSPGGIGVRAESTQSQATHVIIDVSGYVV